MEIPDGLNTPIVYLSIELGIYDQFQKMENTSLCQLQITQQSNFMDPSETIDDYWNDATVCPHPGIYQLETYYTVPSIDDYSLHYTPDVRLIFSNTHGRRIGCVLTGPAAIHLYNERKALHGLVFLASALVVFLGVFAILLYMSYLRKVRLEQLREKLRNQQGGRPRSQYFRTLPNGHVPPLAPRLHRTAEASDEEEDDDDDDDDALQISNPAYNETQIPTRPII